MRAQLKAEREARRSGTMPTPPLASNGSEDHVRPSPKRGHSEMNGYADDDDAVSGGEIEVSLTEVPVKKKQKRGSSTIEDADARLAAQLQAEENRLAGGRSTRGGGAAKPTKPKKRAPKKKSAAKIKDEDDSDIENSEASGTKEKRRAGGGFQKPFTLSPELATLCGETQVRPINITLHRG